MRYGDMTPEQKREATRTAAAQLQTELNHPAMIAALSADTTDDRALTDEYRRQYNAGWRTSQRNSVTALERADDAGKPDAWYDGYLDWACGREKWHLAHCTNHNACG